MIKTLLLADDSVVIQKLVGLSFANESIELITTNNGDDAIARAQEARPDLILADVVMPGRNGYEVCEAVKQDPALSHIPVLLLTGTFEAFDEDRAVKVGSSGHITKPFEAQALVDRINEILEQSETEPSSLSPVGNAPQPVVDDQSYDFLDEDPAQVAPPLAAPEGSAPLAAMAAPKDPAAPPPLAPPTPVSTGLPEDLGAGVPDSTTADAFTFEAETTSNAVPPAAHAAPPVTPAEARADRTIAMIPPVPDAAPTPANTMDFDELGAIVLPGETSDLGDPSSASTAGMGADPGATQLVPDPFGDGASVSGAVGFGSADLEPNPLDSPPPDIVAGDTLLADDLFGESQSDVEPLAVAGDSAELIEDFDLGSGGNAAAQAAPGPSMLDSNDGINELSRSQIMDDEPAASNFETQPIPDHVPESPPPGNEAATLGEPSMNPPKAPGATARIDPLPVGESAQTGLDLSPMMRARLHESLEKIAWEAFADVSDTIVRQVIKRVEAVAWEVIPRMAEALIQEEIRRMKGEQE